MDTNNINKATLTYLTNPLYQHVNNNKVTNNKNYSKEEKKFYKKRILSLTRDMFKNQFENENLKKSFELYLSNLIEHFKTIDKKDIIQEDYLEYNEENNDDIIITNTEDVVVEADNMLLNDDIKVKSITLDNFVISSTIKNTKEHFIPQRKNIDLKEPTLKMKGIKKNNLK
tara:strand:+ start:568 stop:1080 length:513 start_codon:yes stop_codon:yes gene_type:complete